MVSILCDLVGNDFDDDGGAVGYGYYQWFSDAKAATVRTSAEAQHASLSRVNVLRIDWRRR